MPHVEASGIVPCGRRELFFYTDWCYNVPTWFEPVRTTRILVLPDATGMGKVTRYAGTLLGRDMEWEGRSAEWKDGEVWMMKAFRGMPAKMNMGLRLQFEAVAADQTRVTCSVRYHAPYPLLGALLDRFYIRKEALRMARLAIEGMRRVAEQGRVPRVEEQVEKRKADHPGYGVEPTKTTGSAPMGR